MTASIAGNNGGYFATDGNVYSPLWDGWLNSYLNNCIKTNGSVGKLDPVGDINSFYNGVALFSGSTLNNPVGDWGLVIAAGVAGTTVQIIYSLFNHCQSYHRYCAGGAWSIWVRTDDVCRLEYWNGVGALMPYGNVAVFRMYDDTGYASIQASAFTQMSSKYAKDNVEDITDEEADKVLKLRTVTFDYKNGDKDQVGFIAEEVLKILPNCVFLPDDYVEDPDAPLTKLPSIDYSKFVPYLVKEIQILSDKLQKFENKLSTLEN